ncbi:MAG: damage-inducible protein CinA [Rhodobiaceae bacterium]|jgi:nicotinamide-nucleotide amidase|nr:damage-inducible protein CinA [Rhodobiaceae bacterium]|tara:strand:- start:136 stop:627 length:492 start_codon:yes stop_codon:yes gene_type:complete
MNKTKIDKLTQKVIKECDKQKRILAVAESCTGGMLSSYITSISGSSNIFDRGFITYSNDAKIDLIDVKKKTIEKFGAVSKETAIEMAEGTIKNSLASLAISITGVAGPGGGTSINPVGTVYIAIIIDDEKDVKKFNFLDKGREFIRKASVYEALQLLLNKLKK